MLSTAFVILTLAAAFGALICYRSSAQMAEGVRLPLQVASLGAVFIALGAASQLLLSPVDVDQQTLQRLFTNLARYTAWPLMALATLVLARQLDWQRAAWGRGLLGLFAMFELCRRMGYGSEYTVILAGISAAILFYSAMQLKSQAARLLCAAAAVLQAVALLVLDTPMLLPGFQSPELTHLLLALSVLGYCQGMRQAGLKQTA